MDIQAEIHYWYAIQRIMHGFLQMDSSTVAGARGYRELFNSFESLKLNRLKK